MKPISWRKKMKFKKLLLLITFLFITATAIGATLEGVTLTGVSFDAIPVGGGGGGSCSYVHCNGFETQADDDDWTTVSGSPDFDNVWVIEGSESLQLAAGAAVSIVVTARAETWITFMLRFNDNNESTESLVLFYNNSTLLGTFLYEHDNNMKVQAEGGTLSGGESVNANASTKYIKLRFKQGTGVNAELEFWASSDGTVWSQNLSSTDGTSTAQVNKIVFQNTHDNEIMRLDNFMENSADIADAT